MFKNFLLLLFLLGNMSTWGYAQQVLKITRIEETQVPAPVKASYEESLGYEILHWEKVSLNANQERYVATYLALDNASGQMTTRRARYNPAGRLTSMNTYCLAKGQKADSQALQIQLGTGGVEEASLQRFEKVMRSTANIVSFERVLFQPGNANQERESISLLRIVSKNKNRIAVAYYDMEMKPFDAKAYPVRVLEMSDMDSSF
jgi:hypothetical protein